MAEQVGWRGLLRHVEREAPQWGVLLPQLPRLLHRALNERRDPAQLVLLAALVASQQQRTRLTGVVIGVLIVLLLVQLYIGFS
jgi:ubiquinone biosynthesis protein